jgi:L-asparagine transporter-like permease
MLITMRASAIWLCLALLWLIDTGLALRRHDSRQALIAGAVAGCFLVAGFYFARKPKARRR